MPYLKTHELIRFGSRRLELFEVSRITWSEFELVFDLGMVSVSRAGLLAHELKDWLMNTPHALEALTKFHTDNNEKLYRVNDYLYELARKHPSALSQEAKRDCVNLAYLRKSILDFGYRAGEAAETHRHQVNVLRVDEDGFLGCKSDRLRSYKFENMLWAANGLNPEVVTEEWAVVAKFTPFKKITRVHFELVEVKGYGHLKRLPPPESSIEVKKPESGRSLRNFLPRRFR